MEYKVEILSFVIKSLNVKVDMEKSVGVKLESQHRATVRIPKDNADPTVLINADFSMKDTETNHLMVECEADVVFQFDPIPEDRVDASRQHCPELLQREFNRKVTSVLRMMGHEIAVS